MKIIITGMHRSGTSMIAGLLKLCGLYLGNNLIGGLKDNPKGHFEDRDFVHINHKLFLENEGEWGLPPQKIQKISPKLQAEIKAFLRKWPRDRLVGWKDPRACITLPVWIKAIKPEPLKVVLIRRPVTEIAQSLKKRNNFTYDKSAWLTRFYIESAKENLKGIPYIETHYHRYFENWKAELKKVCEFIGLRQPEDTSQIESFIDPKLWHHRSSEGALHVVR